MQNRGGNATRHRHGAAGTTPTGSLRRFVTGDPLPPGPERKNCPP